ncbi:hypothetical protein DRW41_00495 [Neobacillus piezotolerans]|uniref:Uncharacterized protein n=1 Tax=Neobacillus piezotolerans TaxID=2259171 RepID=A0A3D8GV48_9BACI|nr:hypothetical protein [Neobacillus piezotolerans]RDU38089.1 hypothetical protein DRW41_00495 [Neobacillus piezotolerans]
MSEIWIVKERISKNFFDELDHHIRLDGDLGTAYFIEAGGEDYIEQNKGFLLKFLIQQNIYPLYITFIVYDEQKEEHITLLNQKKIEFTLNHLEEKRAFGKQQYHPPYFTARVDDSEALALLLNETYWLPAQNEFFSISFSDNLLFELGEVTEWGRKRKRSIAIFKIETDTTFITISHDGAGFYLFSNEEKYNPIDKFVSNLPKGTVITQINDRLVTGNNFGEE